MKKTILQVPDLCCATEQRIIEKQIQSLKNISKIHCDFINKTVTVEHELEEKDISKVLKKSGFDSNILSSFSLVVENKPITKTTTFKTTVIATVLTAFAILFENVFDLKDFAFILFISAIIFGGWSIAKKAWYSIKNLSLDMNMLMTAAVIGALFIGETEEATAVIVLFAIAELLEEFSLARTRKELKSLVSLAPKKACVRRNEVEIIISAKDVLLNEIIIVRPGEKIPVDGKVIFGYSFVNESAITGESFPVEKKVGDFVRAGGINESGVFEIEAQKVGDDTTLSHIVHLIEKAQEQKSQTQTFVEKFSTIYTTSIFSLSIIVATVPPIFFGASFTDWFYQSLVLLVIACPCAFVISTPVTLVTGLTAMARRGILIKGGRLIEEASRVKTFIFDKTGTLTHGELNVAEIISLNNLTPDDILRIAANVEYRSTHPFAVAIVKTAHRKKIAIDLNLEEFVSLPGRGIKAKFNGEYFFVGSHAFIEELKVCSPEVEKILYEIEIRGKTPVIIANEKKAIGVIALSDELRSDTKLVLKKLRQLGIENQFILSGDNKVITKIIADELEIKNFEGELLPEEKLNRVKDLKNKFKHVAMVGDGINDAPALASSSLGIAMAHSATDVALDTADVILMREDLNLIPEAIKLSRKTVSILKQNISLALGIKGLFLILSLFGSATLWLAIVADDGVTLAVILNSMRLLKLKK